jgi:superfamily II DNA helicase RecQ
MNIDSSLILLIAPPASGKTYWIESFKLGLGKKSLLVVSPLRALADECKQKWGDSIRVMTPEEWLLKQEIFEVVIFDEFHLNFYWGDSFRPILWEVFFALSVEASLCVILSATFSDFMLEEIKLFNRNFSEILMCDFGNRQLKYPPKNYYQCPSKYWTQDYLENGPKPAGVTLIFCAYRSEVKNWTEKLQKKGHLVWDCVGGEAKEMKNKMAQGVNPDYIVATSVLSHGVNLPPIATIFFLYPLGNVDFWIQMVARGGRKGEEYRVFALEKPIGIKWNRFSNFLAILGLSFKMKLHLWKRDIDQWFLKESS